MEKLLLQLTAQLGNEKSKKQINKDIKELEKTLSILRITGVFAKGDTKRKLNQSLKALQSQLKVIKLKGKFESKCLLSEIDKTLSDVSFKDIDILNIDESKTKLKVRKAFAYIKAFADSNPISVPIRIKKEKLQNELNAFLNKNTKINDSSILSEEVTRIKERIASVNDRKALKDAADAFQLYKSEVRAVDFSANFPNDTSNGWDSFVHALANKDALQGTITVFDELIQKAKNLEDVVKELPAALTALNSALSVRNEKYGITQLWNKETDKFDIQGNMFGIDFTAIKDQKKHFDKAKEAISKWNDIVAKGNAKIDTFENPFAQNNPHLKDYLAQLPKNSPASLEGYRSHLTAAGVATDALRLKTLLLNSAIGFGLGLALQITAKGFAKVYDDLVNRVDNARDAMDASQSSYSGESEALEALRTQAEHVQKKLADLENTKGIHNLVDDVEYQKLKRLNEELEHNLQIQEARQKLAALDAWNNAKTYFDEVTQDERVGFSRDISLNEDTISGHSNASYHSPGQYSDFTIEANKHNINFLIGAYDGLGRKLAEIRAEMDTLTLAKANASKQDADAIQSRLDGLEGQRLHMESIQSVLSGHLASYAYGLEDIVRAYENARLAGNQMFETDTQVYHAAKLVLDAVSEKVYGLGSAFEQAGDAGAESGARVKSFTDSISQVQALSKGLNQLGRLYSDVRDQGSFDWASMLNNDDFKNAFEGAGQAYETFIETVSKSPDDIDACQSAFDDLAAAYIKNSGALDGLSEETNASVVALLKQMNIVNADELAAEALAKSQAEAEWASRNLAAATSDEILALIEEAGATGTAQDAFATYLVQKMLAEAALDLSADITALSNIVESLGIATSAWQTYYRTRSILSQMDASKHTSASGRSYYSYQTVENGEIVSHLATQEEYEQILKESQEASKQYAQDLEDNLGKVKYKTVPQSGSAGRRSSGSGTGSSKRSTKDFYDWIETLLSRTDETIRALQERAANALGWQAKNELQDTVFDQLKAKLDALSASYDRYLAQADQVSLSDSLKHKVQTGAIDIEPLDDTTKQLVSDYANWYSKAQEIKKTSWETRQELEGITKLKLDNIAEGFADNIETLDANVEALREQAEETVGWQAKNKLQDTIYDQLSHKLSELQAEQALYQKEMLSLGLSDLFKRKIEDGTLTTEEFNSLDESVRTVVDAYRDLYTRSQKSGEAIRETNEAIRETKEERLDNLLHDYEQVVSLLDQYTNYQQKLLELYEKQGTAMPNQHDYQDLIDDQATVYRQLEEEYEQLTQALSHSDLQKGSEKWNEMQEQLIEIKVCLLDCADAVEDFKDRIIELRFKPFDDLIQKLKASGSELSDLSSLLGEEGLTNGGMLTDKGLAKVALYGQQLLNAKKQAAEYANAIMALEASLENGDITQDEFNERLYEYQSAQRQASMDTKDAMDAIIDLREQAIEEEIDAMNELIDTKKEALEAEEDLDEYQKKTAGFNQSLAALEKQIATLSLASDHASRAKRLQLEQELSETRQELADYQHTYSVDRQKEALDEHGAAYEEAKRKETEELRTDLAKQQALLETYLGQVRNQYAAVYTTLGAYADAYSMELTNDLLTPFTSATEAAQSFTAVFSDMVSQIQYDLDSIDWSAFESLPAFGEGRPQTGSPAGGHGSYEPSYEDVTGRGSWKKAADNRRWWYGTSEEDYVSGGYYQIGEKIYGFDDAGYMLTGWDDSQGEWRYFEPANGQMVRSSWRKGKDGTWYYLTADGTMARNAVVEAGSGEGYYYVNEKGEYHDSDGILSREELEKLDYDVVYKHGTRHALPRLALTDEEGLGSEVIVTKEGALRQLDSGDHVFNASEVERLHDLVQVSPYRTGIADLSHNLPTRTGASLEVHSPLIQIDGSGLSRYEVEALIKHQVDNVPKLIEKSIRYHLR